MYRFRDRGVEVFLVHPGGPFWAKKDRGAWSIPKGEYTNGEQALKAARREFQEETGFAAPDDCSELGSVRQSTGRIVTAWACEGDCDPAQLTSNLCQVEWPPRSGQMMDVPEIDRGAWFSIPAARDRILSSQSPFLDMFGEMLDDQAISVFSQANSK